MIHCGSLSNGHLWHPCCSLARTFSKVNRIRFFYECQGGSVFFFCVCYSWWRHKMVFHITSLCDRNPSVTRRNAMTLMWVTVISVWSVTARLTIEWPRCSVMFSEMYSSFPSFVRISKKPVNVCNKENIWMKDISFSLLCFIIYFHFNIHLSTQYTEKIFLNECQYVTAHWIGKEGWARFVAQEVWPWRAWSTVRIISQNSMPTDVRLKATHYAQ